MQHLYARPRSDTITVAIVATIFAIAVGPAPAERRPVKVEIGVMSRFVEGDVSAAPPELLTWQDFVGRRRGGGDLELYDGDGSVDYLDGGLFEVSGPPGIDSAFLPGMVGVSIESDGQVEETSSVMIGGNDFPSPIGRADFHSTRYSYRSGAEQTPLEHSDDDRFLAPYIAVSGPLPGSDGEGPAFMVCRYAFGDTSIGSPWMETVRQEIIEKRRTYYFEYDVAMMEGIRFPDAPFETPDQPVLNPGPVAVFNPERTIPGMGGDFFEDPRMRIGGRERVIETFRAVSRVEIDLQLHELLLGIGADCDLGNRVHAGVTIGPTLNLVDWDMDHTTRWSDSRGAVIREASSSDSGQEFAIGGLCEGSLSCDLDKDGNTYISAFAGFVWVDEIKTSTGAASAVIDFTSWFFGAGAGMEM